jgi:citrate synthase
VKAFNKEFGKHSLGEVTVGQVIGGMRGLPGMLYETSKLHHMDGITYRGHDLFKIREIAPKTIPGGQPIPEGVLWLLLTGEFPSDSEITEFKADMF